VLLHILTKLILVTHELGLLISCYFPHLCPSQDSPLNREAYSLYCKEGLDVFEAEARQHSQQVRAPTAAATDAPPALLMRYIEARDQLEAAKVRAAVDNAALPGDKTPEVADALMKRANNK